MSKISYKNIYGTEKYKEFIDSQRYVIDDKFLAETKDYELSDGFFIERSVYEDREQKDKQYIVTKAFVSEIVLKNADKTIYKYYCFDYGYTSVFKDIIHHKNGHRYYPFHIDLYGISYLDVDTLEVYNYIPEGYKHKEEIICGESFIITNIHYDEKSNLIAYGGCYWAAPSDIMVGDFSNPLNFNPHLVSLCDIFDPDCDYDYDIDFKEWKDGRLYVLCDNKTEKSVSADELKDMIKEKSK